MTSNEENKVPISSDNTSVKDVTPPDSNDKPQPWPAMYNQCTVTNLTPGSTKSWCTCGLSKTQPWCDDRGHIGTSFKPLKWKVPIDPHGADLSRKRYAICACKNTKNPPYCDGSHIHLPSISEKRISECKRSHQKSLNVKLCEGCGWTPLYESW